ncbi:hypothetical protein D3H55_18205 [Bacillus salacetis]|uniref:Uncharacterized protein n=1 Tax=Bacillus salacetis TaxID=2315464 RepID=A0A3A1QTS1_9BACI|nr:hypothetical protein D3H55_18205 [Bacillus salacetis]
MYCYYMDSRFISKSRVLLRRRASESKVEVLHKKRAYCYFSSERFYFLYIGPFLFTNPKKRNRIQAIGFGFFLLVLFLF